MLTYAIYKVYYRPESEVFSRVYHNSFVDLYEPGKGLVADTDLSNLDIVQRAYRSTKQTTLTQVKEETNESSSRISGW